MKPRKAVYQVNLRLTEADNARLDKIRAKGIGNMDIFRAGLEAVEKKNKS